MAAQVVTIANTKGGVGKSTIAVNLAAEAARAGQRVLLIDADPQQSAVKAAAVRSEDDSLPQFQAVQITEWKLLQQIDKLGEGYDLVLIDAGGRDAPVLRAALMAADTVVVPIVPSTLDAWATADVFAVIDELRTTWEKLGIEVRVYVVLNRVTGTISTRESYAAVRDAIREHDGIELLEGAFGNRTAWPQALGEGKSVAEWEPSGKAAFELREFIHQLKLEPSGERR